MPEDHRAWIATLAGSHDHLVEVVAKAGDVEAPSYCAEWTIAQVLSHLGSGAEIGLMNLNAAVSGEEPPARERNVEIWDRWNAKSPADQAADALEVDARHIATLAALDDATLNRVRVPFMGRDLDAAGFVGMRLFEHALHTWDIEVTSDAAAPVLAADAGRLVDRVPDRVARAGRGAKPAATPVRIELVTTDPARAFSLSIEGETVSIDDGAASDGRVELPSEALLRLISGRLDPVHTPASVTASGAVGLDELRALFPGY